MPYDPDNRDDRRELARALRSTLTRAGFQRKPQDLTRAAEEVYFRTHHLHSRIEVRVYTTIEGPEVRAVGADAIRVCAYYDGRPVGGRSKRVHRTGTIEAVCERMLGRMRKAYGSVMEGERCRRCGAPMGVSKNKKLYCLAICWEKKEAS